MRATEQMAVLTALQKAVKARLDEVRAEADAELLAAFEQDGTTKRAIRLGGAKVGDFIVNTAGGDWEVCDEAAFSDFALTYGFAHVRRTVRPGYLPRVVDILICELPEAVAEEVEVDPKWRRLVTGAGGVPTYLDTGLVVPGVRAAPLRAKGTQARGCGPEEVLPLLRELPGGIDALLLGNGDDEDGGGAAGEVVLA